MRKQNLFLAAALFVGVLASCDTSDNEVTSFRTTPGKHVTEENVEYYIPSPADTVINNYSYVDLGLPSGSLWATKNIGATTVSDLGYTYRWGETNYYDRSNWVPYKYEDNYRYTKYNSTDGKLILDSEDDAAFINCGTGCHIPSVDDFHELNLYCTWMYAIGSSGNSDFMLGYLVTSRINGKMIFLPENEYWINTLSSEDHGKAVNIYLDEDDYELSSGSRDGGMCAVRAVYKKNFKYGEAYDSGK